ncbi:hypothetical protein OESDEN_21959 [Oesophagostomum dentatum]|uniref:Uncharacterized protein n=1 Tax=Oesophagostomum dentatum TaxID=61180 RepID=A0A0B1S5A4_OESDE|nr:hypothetical protein OESDEN_21959 [Oesophagostomum dentatum]
MHFHIIRIRHIRVSLVCLLPRQTPGRKDKEQCHRRTNRRGMHFFVMSL